MTTSLIKMPKDIKTLEQFNEWCKSLNTDRQDFEIVMKKRLNFHPFAFREVHHGRIHYLIDDGVSRGLAKIENFNKIFTFRIRKYHFVEI